MPEILITLIETVDEAGPFGAKGLGEAGTITISAAVANAIKQATGVRMAELPMTPERVYRALRRRDLAPSHSLARAAVLARPSSGREWTRP